MKAVFTCNYFGGNITHEPCIRTECGFPARMDCSGLNYRDALNQCGCEAEPVYCIGFSKSREALLEKVRKIVSRYDALVLTGGGDMASPAAYDPENFARHSPTISYTLPERDEVEYALLQAFIDAGKPVLGVCRGMQLINCFFGGTLYADLGEKTPIHSPAIPGNYLNHEAEIRPGTWLEDAGLPIQLQVNSHHHQAVCRLGDGLAIDAYSNDGVAEAMHHGRHKIIAVQWHPERMFAFEDNRIDEPSLAIFRYFLSM